MKLTTLWSRMVAVISDLSYVQQLERIAVSLTALTMIVWFQINGLPHVLWLIPLLSTCAVSTAALFEALSLALKDTPQDGSEPGWEAAA